MTNFNENEHPRGHQSNAGAFSDKQQGTPEVMLGDETPVDLTNWGNTGLHMGSRTPWGPADNVEEPAPGITIVGTPSHGGIKLSAARNKLIPPVLRKSWYEEDCESAIVGMYFPEAFPRWTQEQSEETVKRWFPDEYEAATGKKVLPGESNERDRAVWLASHADSFVVDSNPQDEETPGFKRVQGRRADGAVADFLISSVELSDRKSRSAPGQNGRLVVDPDRHEQVEALPKPVKVPMPLYTGVIQPKTDAARALFAKDLRKRWRRSDGTIETLEQILGRGVSGKSASVDEYGKRSYYLKEQKSVGDSSYPVLPVTKATFNAVEAPDSRTPRDIDRENVEIARYAYDNARFPADQRRLANRLNALVAKSQITHA